MPHFEEDQAVVATIPDAPIMLSTVTIGIETPEGTVTCILGRGHVGFLVGKAGAGVNELISQTARALSLALRTMDNSMARAYMARLAKGNGWGDPPFGYRAQGIAHAVWIGLKEWMDREPAGFRRPDSIRLIKTETGTSRQSCAKDAATVPARMPRESKPPAVRGQGQNNNLAACR